MKFLLDTNVISETIKANANEQVISWLRSIPDDCLFASVISIGEIRKGIEKLTVGKKKQHLTNWLENNLTNWLGDRLLTIDLLIAEQWGRIQAESSSYSDIDGLIGATALTCNLCVATRNTKHFQYPGLQTYNPWKDE